MKKCAISLNFDSMREAQGFPPDSIFRDESYFKVADRLFSLLGDDVRISIYIIGKDLENKEIAARVKDWASAGHEIGNHTFSHPQDFGILKGKFLSDEITRAHELISEVTGVPPEGFISPGWSIPAQAYDVLHQLQYSYDLSCFASPWIFPVTAKLIFNELRCGEFRTIFKTIQRQDYLSCLIGKDVIQKINRLGQPAGEGEHGIYRLPMPKNSYLSLPIWHTAGFIFGFDRLAKQITKFSTSGRPFYYTMHPADLFELADFDYIPSETHLERVNIPLREKIDRFSNIFQVIRENFQPVTVKELVYIFQTDHHDANS